MKEPLRGIRFRTVRDSSGGRPLHSNYQHNRRCSYDFHIAGNGLYTMLVTTGKDSKTSKHVSILYQL